GITQININLTTQKLFALDSPLIELDKLRVDYQVPQYSMATVFVSNLGNLSDTKLQDLGSLVNKFENLTGSWGTVGTRFFLRDFLSYENSLEGNELDTIPKEDIVKKLSKLYNPDDLRSFITWPEYTYYRGFIKFKDDTNELDRFFFTTAYHGENLKIWAERAKMLNQWRDTIDKY
uniref:Uncharacterized protein n=1 Tax=Acrobeloides nanus TaxID=290746 RepID=A0A914D4Y5_9BILA